MEKTVGEDVRSLRSLGWLTSEPPHVVPYKILFPLLLMRHGRRRDPELFRQLGVHQPRHYGNQGVVMNGVRDGIDHLPPERGAGHRRITVGVADFAARSHRRVEGAEWKVFE